MAKTTPLDQFGAFVMEKLRDPGIDHFDGLLAKRWKAPALKKLQRELGALTNARKAVVRQAFVESMDEAIHAFLFALAEESESGGAVRVRVRGKDVASLSDGLQGELFTEEGWFARFSAHGEPVENS